MRLWSLHPSHLDSRGLVALWREALLAQKVLRGLTRGYKHHPQLARFRSPKDYAAQRKMKIRLHPLFRTVPGGVACWERP